MDDQTRIAKDLVKYAENLVWQLIRQHGLGWDKHRREDAVHELFVAGWEDYQKTGEVGLAKHRMASRKVNLLRDFYSEREHEPKVESSLPEPEEGQPTVLEAKRAYTSDPVERAIWNEALARLTDRQRQIVAFRRAGLTQREIADEMGISLSTVERELSDIRKELDYVRQC